MADRRRARRSRRTALAAPPSRAEAAINWRAAGATRPAREVVDSSTILRPDGTVDSERALEIEKTLDCTGLAAHFETMLSLFQDGWMFLEVVQGRKGRSPPYDQVPQDSRKWEYLPRKIDNAWNDLALYRRRLARPEPRNETRPMGADAAVFQPSGGEAFANTFTLLTGGASEDVFSDASSEGDQIEVSASSFALLAGQEVSDAPLCAFAAASADFLTPPAALLPASSGAFLDASPEERQRGASALLAEEFSNMSLNAFAEKASAGSRLAGRDAFAFLNASSDDEDWEKDFR